MSIFLFVQKVYILSKTWDTYRHVDQWEFLCGHSTKTYVCTYVQKHPNVAMCDGRLMGLMTTVVVLVQDALLFLLEVCSSALLSGHQRSPLPAGQGSQRSDLHLGEVQGRQVALPRFPVHSLTAIQRDWARKRLKIGGETREKRKAKYDWKEKSVWWKRRERAKWGRVEKGETQRGQRWRQKRQAPCETGRMTNTNKYHPLASFHVSTNLFWLLLHFADKHCGRHVQLQYYGWNLDKNRDLPWHILEYQSSLDIITVVVTLSAW